MAPTRNFKTFTRWQPPTGRLQSVTRQPGIGIRRQLPPRRLQSIQTRPAEQENRGFLRNIVSGISQLGTAPIKIAIAGPTIIGKLGQTAYGFGEGIYDFATDLASEALGRDEEFFTSRLETDLEKGRKLGLKGTDLIAYATHRQYPFGSEIVKSFGTETIPSLAELATLGQIDFGKPGFDYKREFQAGNIGNKLFEDVGNIMLFGRGAGLGPVATRAGRSLTSAGMPRLGTAVRRAGYFSEQPIAATLRGGARLTQRGLTIPSVARRTGVLGSRLAESGRRISGSQTPLLETFNVARAGLDLRTQARIDEALKTENDLKAEKARAQQTGDIFPEEKEIQLRNATQTVEDLQKRTAQGRSLRRFSQQAMVEGEAMRRGFVQPFTRYSALGAVPESMDSLLRQMDAEMGRVARGETGRQLFVDHIDRKMQAKVQDPNNTILSSPEMINDSFAAAVIVGTELVDVIKAQVEQGVPISEIIARITPRELPEFVKPQGYALTPSAIQKALDYVEGRLDGPDRVLDRVSIDQVLIMLRSLDEFMASKRRTGEGMVRGAGDPFERGQFPIPRYVLSAIDEYAAIGPKIERVLDARIAQLLVVKYPQLIEQLDIDINNPEGLFRQFAETPNNIELYTIAYEAIQLAMVDLYGASEFRDFVNDPLIFPAKMRIKVKAQQGVIQAMRGEDITNLADSLTRFAEEFPDVLPQGIVKRIDTLVDIANDPQLRLNKDNWYKAQGIVRSIYREIGQAQNRIIKKRGELNALMDQDWIRLEELAAATESAYGMIQTIIDQPQLFADQAALSEAGRLRGVAEEAQTGVEQLGPIQAPETVRFRSAILQETERLAAERADATSQLDTTNRDIETAQRELAEAEALTPEDIARLEGERDIALEVEKEVPFTKVDKGEIDRQLAAEISERVAMRRQFKQDFDEIQGKKPTTDGRDLTEDLSTAISQGLGAGSSKKLYESFVRRFFLPKRQSNPQTRRGGEIRPFGWDEVAEDIKRSLGLDPLMRAEDAWTALAERWALDQRIKKELVDLRSPESREAIAKRIQDELDVEVDRYRQEQYQDLGLVDEAGLARSSEDYNRIIERARNSDVLRLRLETLRRQAQDLSARLAQIDRQLATNASDLEAVGLMGERSRLRRTEQEATQQASQLESTALKGQRDAVKARLKGVGRVVDGEPQLQRQFASPIEAEAAALEAKQIKDRQTVQELRESFARQDEALAAAQAVSETPLLAEQERSRFMVGRGEGPIYIPVGASRLVTPVSQIDMGLRVEGIAPESVGSFERMREGTILQLTPGQLAARLDETMNALSRNIVMDRIITQKQFVSTVAEVIPIERRTAMMDQATQTIENSRRNLDSGEKQRLVNMEYQKLLFDELQKQGLDPISPVEMPDPMDIYAERAALGALDERVNYTQIDDTTLVMPRGMRQGLASQFQAIGTGPLQMGKWAMRAAKVTSGWKSNVLPWSVRWQTGDHVTNILNAWVRGDVPPQEIYRLMQELLPRMQGENLSFGELALDPRAQEYLRDPVMQALETMGLQSSGRKVSDLREMRKDTLQSAPELSMSTGRLSKLTAPKTRQKSFAFNEFQNRWVRHTLAFKKLQDILDEQGRSIDEVSETSIQTDPVLYKAVEEAVATTNDALGNFSQMTEFERRYVRSAYPFWAWVKYINKAAAQLAVTHPDKLLFVSHLGGLTMEKDAEGLWQFLQGKSNVPGLGLVDLQWLNPYSDAILFKQNPVKALFDQATNLSPAIIFPATVGGELYYGAEGTRLPLLPTLSRPSYLEGRPGETTRTVGDVLGGIGYLGLKTFGGQYRNILDVGVPFTSISGRIPGTDVYYGPGQRFGQGSLRTVGPYAEPRLSRGWMQASALLKTFGIPAPLAESEFAERMAAQTARRRRLSYRRRLGERRKAERRLG